MTNTLRDQRMWRTAYAAALAVAVLGILPGCQAPVQNPAGVSSIDVDSSRKGPVSGIGVESQDIVAMTDQMLRDMLAEPIFANTGKRPRVVVDSELFVNESSQALNKSAITQRLRINLNRAARQRIQFVDIESMSAVERERALKRSGTTDIGTTGLTKAVLGVDYKLKGKILSVDSRNNKTGMVQRYTQIAFEMLDMETSELVWGGLYEFTRAAADDVIYR